MRNRNRIMELNHNGKKRGKSRELEAWMGAVRIRHSIREIATLPVILWIPLGGKPIWLPLNFGFNDVMRTGHICATENEKECLVVRQTPIR